MYYLIYEASQSVTKTKRKLVLYMYELEHNTNIPETTVSPNDQRPIYRPVIDDIDYIFKLTQVC